MLVKKKKKQKDHNKGCLKLHAEMEACVENKVYRILADFQHTWKNLATIF